MDSQPNASIYETDNSRPNHPRKIESAMNFGNFYGVGVQSATLKTRFNSANIQKRLVQSAMDRKLIPLSSKYGKEEHRELSACRFFKSKEIDFDLLNDLQKKLDDFMEPKCIDLAEIYNSRNYLNQEISEVILRLGFLLSEKSQISEAELDSCFGSTQSIACQRLDFKRAIKYLLDGTVYCSKGFYEKALHYFRKLSRQFDMLKEDILYLFALNQMSFCSFKLKDYNLCFKFSEMFNARAKGSKWEFTGLLTSLLCSRRLLNITEQKRFFNELYILHPHLSSDKKMEIEIQKCIQLIIERRKTKAGILITVK
jgi:hypothetical protein